MALFVSITRLRIGSDKLAREASMRVIAACPHVGHYREVENFVSSVMLQTQRATACRSPVSEERFGIGRH